jgi:hypothetical protein
MSAPGREPYLPLASFIRRRLTLLKAMPPINPRGTKRKLSSLSNVRTVDSSYSQVYVAFLQEGDGTKITGKLVRIPSDCCSSCTETSRTVPWTERSEESSKESEGL